MSARDKLIDRQGRALLRLERHAMKDMAGIYMSARSDLLDKLAAIAPGAQPFTEREALATLRRLEDGIRIMEGEMDTMLIDNTSASVRLSLEHVGAHFALAKMPPAIWDGAKGPVVRRMATYQQLAAHRFESSVRRYGTVMLNKFRQQIMTGLVAGETMDDITRRIRKQVPAGSPIWREWSRTYGTDRVRKPILGGAWYNAERIVRTELIDAYNTSNVISIKETNALAAKYDLAVWGEWSAALESGRVCQYCRGYHGETRPPGESFGTYMGDPVYKPTVHPHCMCVIYPRTVDISTGKPIGE